MFICGREINIPSFVIRADRSLFVRDRAFFQFVFIYSLFQAPCNVFSFLPISFEYCLWCNVKNLLIRIAVVQHSLRGMPQPRLAGVTHIRFTVFHADVSDVCRFRRVTCPSPRVNPTNGIRRVLVKIESTHQPNRIPAS